MPAEQTADRVARLLALMSYLTGRKEVPLAELSDHFGVPRAQITKDLYLLWMSGAPGYMHNQLIDFEFSDDESTVTLVEGQGLARAAPFAPREAMALGVAVEWLAALGSPDQPTAQLIDTLRGKLRGLLPADVLGVIPLDAGRRELITQAIDDGGALAIRYVSAADDASDRIILPEVLTTDGNHWYLDAWCTRAGARRTFRTDRILELSPAPMPDGKHASAADSTEVREVQLTLRPAARWFADELPDSQLKVLPDGSVEVTLSTNSWEWLVRRLLGLGSSLIAVAPIELMEEVKRRAAAGLAAYGAS